MATEGLGAVGQARRRARIPLIREVIASEPAFRTHSYFLAPTLPEQHGGALDQGDRARSHGHVLPVGGDADPEEARPHGGRHRPQVQPDAAPRRSLPRPEQGERRSNAPPTQLGAPRRVGRAKGRPRGGPEARRHVLEGDDPRGVLPRALPDRPRRLGAPRGHRVLGVAVLVLFAGVRAARDADARGACT